jgi:hypothetical protein
MKLDKYKLYIKFVEFDTIYNFVFDGFFIWNI